MVPGQDAMDLTKKTHIWKLHGEEIRGLCKSQLRPHFNPLFLPVGVFLLNIVAWGTTEVLRQLDWVIERLLKRIQNTS